MACKSLIILLYLLGVIANALRAYKQSYASRIGSSKSSHLSEVITYVPCFNRDIEALYMSDNTNRGMNPRTCT